MKALLYSIFLSICLSFLVSCATVEKSQVMGDWNLYNYESPDRYLNSYMNTHREHIRYHITDSLAFFTIDGKDMYVSNWNLESNQLLLSSTGGSATNWRIMKVDDNNLILRANNQSIGKRTYQFKR